MVEDGKYELVRKNEVISLIQTNGVCKGVMRGYEYSRDLVKQEINNGLE